MSFFTNLMAGSTVGGGAVARTLSEIQEEQRLREIADADEAYRMGVLQNQEADRLARTTESEADRESARIQAGYARLQNLQTNPDIKVTIPPGGIDPTDPMRGVGWTKLDWEDTPEGLASAAADARAIDAANVDIDAANRNSRLLGQITRAYGTTENMESAANLLRDAGMSKEEIELAQGLFIDARSRDTRSLGAGAYKNTPAKYEEIPKEGTAMMQRQGQPNTPWERELAADSAATVAGGRPWTPAIGEMNLTTPKREYIGPPPIQWSKDWSPELKQIANSLPTSLMTAPNREATFRQRAEALGVPADVIQGYLIEFPIK